MNKFPFARREYYALPADVRAKIEASLEACAEGNIVPVRNTPFEELAKLVDELEIVATLEDTNDE